jgi:hypothetical protein
MEAHLIMDHHIMDPHLQNLTNILVQHPKVLRPRIQEGQPRQDPELLPTTEEEDTMAVEQLHLTHRA